MPRQRRKHRTRDKRQAELRRACDEEQRHLCGRRIPGIERPRFNGQGSFSSGVRCRPALMELDQSEREFRDYKHQYVEELPHLGEQVTEEVRALR